MIGIDMRFCAINCTESFLHLDFPQYIDILISQSEISHYKHYPLIFKKGLYIALIAVYRASSKTV